MTDDCVFCKIVKAELPSYKVYEDENFLAFLDIEPFTQGHTLVIPKMHYRWVYDVPNFGQYFEVARKIGLAQIKALKADWLTFLTLGKEVPHAHIHVVPRQNSEKSESLANLHYSYSENEMQKIAEEIKNNI